MPESVLSGYNRDLGWDVNVPGEKSNWSYLEKDNLYELCKAHGLRGAIRFEDYRDHGSFANMISDLGGDGMRHTVLLPDNVTITAATTIPANITIVRIKDGVFTVAQNTTLTFAAGSKLITENNKKVFNLEGGSSWMSHVDLGRAVDYVTPEMFGGGMDGLVDILEGVITPRRLDIVSDITLSWGLNFASYEIDLASIAPDAHIIVPTGESLVIGSMSATPTHDAFAGSSGEVTFSNNPTAESWVTPCQRVAGLHMLVLESAPSSKDVGGSSTAFGKAYLQFEDGVIVLKVVYNGATYSVVLA